MLSRYYLSIVFFLSFLFHIFSYVSASYALADRCPRHQVKTELKAKKAKTKFLSGSIKGINDYLGSHGVMAFVQNPLSVKTYYKFSTKDIGRGRFCIMLDEVEAHYRSYPSIVMPSDFKKSSCEYKIIRKHEQRHLDVHHNYYEKSVGQYRAFLGRIARNVPVFDPVTTKQEAAQVQKLIKEYFNQQFYKRVKSSINEMHKLQSKIDSAQEYTFTNRRIERCQELEKRKKRSNKKSFYDEL